MNNTLVFNIPFGEFKTRVFGISPSNCSDMKMLIKFRADIRYVSLLSTLNNVISKFNESDINIIKEALDLTPLIKKEK